MNAFDVLKAACTSANKKRKQGPDEDSAKTKYKRYEEKRTRTFAEKWCEGRPWLFHQNGKMFCSWCKDHNVDSNFVKGTDNFKLETIKQHENTKWHLYYAPKYLHVNTEEAPAVKCLKLMLKQDSEKLRLKFQTAHALAKHGKSFLDFNFICALYKAKGMNVGNTYCNDKAARSFVSSIAHIERTKVLDKIRKARFFSFTCDGTTDFTGEDLECFYVRICINGTIEDIFINIGSPESSSSEDIFNYVINMFKEYDINSKKLVGFTADGASNMQGLKSGLAARLLVDAPHIMVTHCVAHRLELAFKDAIKTSSKTIYEKAMTLLLGLYYFYRKSPKMKKSLKRSFTTLNQRQILPIRVGGTRWLPHVDKALNTFFKGYAAIRQQLENASHTNPKAEGLAKLMKDGNLVVFLQILKEVVSHLMRLSLYLQRDGFVLADAYVRVEATKNVLAQLEKRKVAEAENSAQSKLYAGQPLVFKGSCNPSTFLTKLTKSSSDAMTSRFKDNDIVDATSIASFNFGDREVELLSGRFDQVLKESGVEVDQCIYEWTLLKTKVYKSYSTELTEHQLSWATVNHGCADLNNILGLIDLVLSLPATSVRNECLFSTMKLVKGKRRGRLANSTLNDLLLIAVQSPRISEFDPDDAIFHWMSTPGSRRFNYTRQKKDTKVRERSESGVIVDEIPTVATTAENVDEVPVNSIESTEINDENGLDNVPFRDDADLDSDADTQEESDESDYEQSIYENNCLITKYREMENEIELLE